MKIAVTYENGKIYQHFGHTPAFKLYEIAEGKVVSEEVVPTNGSGHGALADFLTDHNVVALICGGIGPGAQMALAQMGIALYAGVAGSADIAVQALLMDRLQYTSASNCNHHGHDHDHGHSCGSHGCGSHDHGHSCGSHCGH